MKREIFILALSLVTPLYGQQVPEKEFAELGTESYEARSAAQVQLEKWGVKNYPKSIDVLWDKFQAAQASPEVKARLLDLMKHVVISEEFEKRGFVGIRMVDSAIHLRGKRQRTVTVGEVVKGSAAEKCGLRVGDQVYGIDAVVFKNSSRADMQFRDYISAKKVGDTVQLKFQRGKQVLELSVVLGGFPDALKKHELSLKKDQDNFFQQWLEKRQAKDS